MCPRRHLSCHDDIKKASQRRCNWCNNPCLPLHLYPSEYAITFAWAIIITVTCTLRWTCYFINIIYESEGGCGCVRLTAWACKNILWMNFGYGYCKSVWCVRSDAEHLWELLRVCLMFDMVLYVNCVRLCDELYTFYSMRASISSASTITFSVPRFILNVGCVGNRFSTRPRCRKFHTWIHSPARQCKLIFINMNEILFASSTGGAQHNVIVCVDVWDFVSHCASWTRTRTIDAQRNQHPRIIRIKRNREQAVLFDVAAVWMKSTIHIYCHVWCASIVGACTPSPSLRSAFHVDSPLFCVVFF